MGTLMTAIVVFGIISFTGYKVYQNRKHGRGCSCDGCSKCCNKSCCSDKI